MDGNAILPNSTPDQSEIAALRRAVALLTCHFDVGGGWGAWGPSADPDLCRYDPALDVYMRRIGGTWEVSTRIAS